MLERTVFLGALEKEDPVARAAYLDAACAGQPALRQRIEELLRSYQALGDFLEVPVLEQLTGERLLPFLEPPDDPGPSGHGDPPP